MTLHLLDRLQAVGGDTLSHRQAELFGSGDMAGALRVYEEYWRTHPIVAGNAKTAMLSAMVLGERDVVERLTPDMVGAAKQMARRYLEGDREVVVHGARRAYTFPFESAKLSIAMRHAVGEFYELTALRKLAPLLSPGDHVVDVGANIGNHTIYFAGELGCRVTSLECNPKLTPLLRKVVKDAGLQAQVDLSHVGKAVADGPGEVFFNFIREDFSNVSRQADDSQTRVSAMSLDSLDMASCRLLKIDVDGGEIGVLRGAEAFLAKHRPVLVIEVMNFNTAEALSLIDKAGYALVRENAQAKTHSDFVFSPAEQELPALQSMFR